MMTSVDFVMVMYETMMFHNVVKQYKLLQALIISSVCSQTEGLPSLTNNIFT